MPLPQKLRNSVIAASVAGAVSIAGVLITDQEGLKYTAYLDPIGIPTVCAGVTGPDVVMGKIYTKQECDTVSGAQKFKPEAFRIDTDGNKENVDNRVAVVNVSSGTGFKRGDKISFAGVKFLSQMAKNVLVQDATFSVVAVNGNAITITPKPVALDDTSLTAEQRAYANVNTSLAAGAAVSVLNTDTVQTNVFWADDSIRLVSQPIPLEHELFTGMKSRSFSIPSVGLNGVIAFQGDINILGGKCRIALWYAASAVRPEAIGVGLPNQNVATAS